MSSNSTATTQANNTSASSNMPQSSSSYAASIVSGSTRYSTDEQKAAGSSQKPRRSFRQRVKTLLSDIGTPPTSRYDREHGLETTIITGPSLPPSRI
jgi:hypothetical protein